MNQTKDVTEPTELYMILRGDTVSSFNIQFVKDDMVQMTYHFKDHFINNSNNTNIYIACFTTRHGRLMLYDKLDFLQEKLLYLDTDSNTQYIDDGTKNIKTGDMLGELTGELSGEAITQFVSTGPKSYSFNYGDYQQNSAITLKNTLLNHDSLSKIVKKQIREITIVNENKIT